MVYDKLSWLTRETMTARHGVTQYLEYDEWDRLKELVDPGNRAFTMEYDLLSRIERLVRPNDTETIYDYSDGAIADSMYLTGILHRKISTGDVIDNIRYTHYADGSRATESRLADTLGNINPRTFTYDASANRLLSVRNDLLPELDEDFSYDKEGNWAAPHFADRVHNEQNELMEDAGYCGSVTRGAFGDGGSAGPEVSGGLGEAGAELDSEPMGGGRCVTVGKQAELVAAYDCREMRRAFVFFPTLSPIAACLPDPVCTLQSPLWQRGLLFEN